MNANSTPANVIVFFQDIFDSKLATYMWQAKAYHLLRREGFIGIVSMLPMSHKNLTGQNITPTKSIISLSWSEKNRSGGLVHDSDGEIKPLHSGVNDMAKLCKLAADVYKDDSLAATLTYEKYNLNLRQ